MSDQLQPSKNFHKNNIKQHSSFIKAVICKLLSIAAVLLTYIIFINQIYADQMSEYNINNVNRAPGVCVFDIDYTLACKGSYAAVEVCKNAGFDLAINTARNKQKAREFLNSGEMENKGFSYEFIENARNQNGLTGPFQFRQSWRLSMPTEQKFQNKAHEY